ncbi:MAG: hypothetical protein R2712_16155 [Vicinamibacterales bacterium]
MPVPLHWTRQWRRGFNQADLLAAGLGVPVRRLLRRVRATPPQVGLTAAARRRNVRDAFALSRAAAFGPSLQGGVVVLVDDVATTGATLDACACAPESGVSEVRALTAARAVPERRR